MKERPILFSAPMVRALLAGQKTQTRRIAKFVPRAGTNLEFTGLTAGNYCTGRIDSGWVLHSRDGSGCWNERTAPLLCPYGVPGDRLWVRENGWERPERTATMMREGADTWAPYYYDADGISVQDAADFKAWGFKRRPSIFMPRSASRIALEVTGVRVERLHAISQEDARAEGMPADAANSPRVWYMALWHWINGAGSWDANPWVWVVEFRRA